MSKFNISLYITLFVLIGVLIGTKLSLHTNIELELAQENYKLTKYIKIEIQNNVLDFYINEYCEDKNVRMIDYNFNGTIFNGIYCDKNTILLLDNEFPPLPFYIGKLGI